MGLPLPQARGMQHRQLLGPGRGLGHREGGREGWVPTGPGPITEEGGGVETKGQSLDACGQATRQRTHRPHLQATTTGLTHRTRQYSSTFIHMLNF